jgi:hypothetical protein
MLLERVFIFSCAAARPPVPLVTAVNGAGGVRMSFALMGDLVLCALSATPASLSPYRSRA